MQREVQALCHTSRRRCSILLPPPHLHSARFTRTVQTSSSWQWDDIYLTSGLQEHEVTAVVKLRQTTCKCLYMMSCDKDGGHITRSAIAENCTLHANFTALSATEPELLPIEVVQCGNMKFCVFLPLCPWTWPNDLQSCTHLTRIPWRYHHKPKMNFLRQGFWQLLYSKTFRHTHRCNQNINVPRAVKDSYTSREL